MRLLILVLISLANTLALAELPRPRVESHLGGDFDANRGRYVPGTGTGAPRPPRELVSRPTVPAIPEGATIATTAYTFAREGRDLETVRPSIFLVGHTWGTFTLGIRFETKMLTTDVQRAFDASQSSLDCWEDNFGIIPRAPARRLRFELAHDGSLQDATAVQQITLGAATTGPRLRTYTGVCSVTAPATGAIHSFRWTIRNADGAMPSPEIQMVDSRQGTYRVNR